MGFPSGVTGAGNGSTHRPWRYLLVVAFVASVIGAFLPMVDIKYGRITMGLTAYDLSFKMEKTRALAETELPRLPKAINKRLENVRSNQTDLVLVLEASRWAVAAFIPGVLLGILGVIGLLRRRVGRVLGMFAIPLGLASIAGWFGLRYALQFAAEEADLGKVSVTLQVGAHALLAIGALGLVAGFGALFSPDREASIPERPPTGIPPMPRAANVDRSR